MENQASTLIWIAPGAVIKEESSPSINAKDY